jgi:hypothetical protein
MAVRRVAVELLVDLDEQRVVAGGKRRRDPPGARVRGAVSRRRRRDPRPDR